MGDQDVFRVWGATLNTRPASLFSPPAASSLFMPPTRKPKDPTGIDPASAKDAFDKILPRAQALPRSQVLSPNTGVNLAAIAALGIARAINDSPLRARLERLPKEEFDIKHLDDLPDLALAAFYAYTEMLSLSAAATDAKIPVALADTSTAHRAIMIKVIGYHFDPESRVGIELADILKGSGYRDLASDLARLGKIYRAEHDTLKEDKRYYRATDADRADELSQKILEELGASKGADQQRGVDTVARIWTLLLKAYSEVSQTGTWLLRNEEGGEIFVSLIAAGRTGTRSRARKSEGDNPTAPDAPGEGGKGG